MTKVHKLLALAISIIFNPPHVLILSFVFGNLELIQENTALAIIYAVSLLLLPFLSFIYIGIKDRHSLHEMLDVSRDERFVVYLSLIYSGLLTTILFTATDQHFLWVANSMLLSILVGVYFLFNKYIDKISMHTGIFAFCIVYLVDKLDTRFVVFLIVLPIISWSRFILKKHTWFQLILGTVLGLFLGILSWTF